MSTRSPTSMAAAISLASAKHAAPAFAREAAKKSSEAKRESLTVIDVLAVEKLANASQLLSGVSISREFGEGERVSILLNGRAVATANRAS